MRWLAFAAMFAVGCGDLYADPIATREGPAPAADVAEPADPPADQKSVDPLLGIDGAQICPSTATKGTPCKQLGIVCEYGASPDLRCNEVLACVPDGNSASPDGGVWTARPSATCASELCPAASGTAAAIDGKPCTEATDELMCPMSDAVCTCTTGVDVAHPHARAWVCVKPAAGCSPTRPLAGSQCKERRVCDYGACTFKRGLRMECDGFAWRTEGATCN